MSSRPCGFDLDLLKSSSTSSSAFFSSSSSSSSSECSSSIVISTKRPRTPRKRPNQSYTEAAILLSTVYPNVFSIKNLPKLSKHCSDPFSPFPVIDNDHFLIENGPPARTERKLSSRVEFKPSVGFDDVDYDVESMLDEEEVAEEGIDSIMGKLSMDGSDPADTDTDTAFVFHPFGGLLGFYDFRRAIRGARNVEEWAPMVEVKDIVPPQLTKSKKKSGKSKKKKKKNDLMEGKLKCGLGLTLNYEEVLDAWSDRKFPFGFSADDIVS